MSGWPAITPADAVAVLNRILEADRAAVSELVLRSKVRCNEKLANDSTVQVKQRNGWCEVGLLGVVNGLFGVDAKVYGPIVAIVTGGPVHVVRFEVRGKA